MTGTQEMHPDPTKALQGVCLHCLSTSSGGPCIGASSGTGAPVPLPLDSYGRFSGLSSHIVGRVQKRGGEGVVTFARREPTMVPPNQGKFFFFFLGGEKRKEK